MTLDELRTAAQALAAEIAALPTADAFVALNTVREALHAVSPNRSEPVDLVRWIPADLVQANNWNPNHVARQEMALLLRSIHHDGYTQPIVAIQDPDIRKYIIVDGFHRNFVAKASAEIGARVHGHLPLTLIEKSVAEQMAATVRHNRARGKHSVDGMANMIFQMLETGMDDASVCNELGLEVEELVRLKHITGFSKLFENTEYRRAWVTKNQIRLKFAQQAKEQGPTPDAAS